MVDEGANFHLAHQDADNEIRGGDPNSHSGQSRRRMMSGIKWGVGEVVRPVRLNKSGAFGMSLYSVPGVPAVGLGSLTVPSSTVVPSRPPANASVLLAVASDPHQGDDRSDG